MNKITLATLEEATEQEVFDQVVTHLLTQKRKSVGQDKLGLGNDCVYRGEDGTMCAAGCIISNEEYNEELFEGYSWTTLCDKDIVPKKHMTLISNLQFIHDKCEVKEWKSKL